MKLSNNFLSLSYPLLVVEQFLFLHVLKFTIDCAKINLSLTFTSFISVI